MVLATKKPGFMPGFLISRGMDPITKVEYCLLESTSSVEEFLKSTFNATSSKLKKYFDKSFLSRSMKAHSTLSLPLNFVNDGLINPDYIGPFIPSLYEDENFLVLDKPANLFVHPLVYEEKNNCLSFLRQKQSSLLLVNRTHYDRGLLYRLDFETSGVLVYVKNDLAYTLLRENFKTVAKRKIYLCRVEGECHLTGSFSHSFSSSEARGKRVVVGELNELAGDKGELSLRAISFDGVTNTTLMEVVLKSGLRHQIRAQLAFLGFPLRGDKFYGGQQAERLYLHAQTYEIEYVGKRFQFHSSPNSFNGL